MSGFKLLAIRPLAGCSRRFLKILKEDKLYKFSNDFEYEFDKENKTVTNIKPLNQVPQNLYSIQTEKRAINLNISAIVGKNGSGKSSLVELLFMAINDIAKTFIPDPIKSLSNVVEKEGDCLEVELYFETSSIFKIHVKGEFNTDPKVIVYQLNGSTFEECIPKFKLKEFFYSIAINYSAYSLDSRELGSWLSEVFHKNDSYQTPLVLNPFRKNGHVNYETEKGLRNDRLLSNVLRKKNSEESFDFRLLTEKQKVEKISLALNSTDYTKKAIYTEYSSTSTKENYVVLVEELEYCRDLLFELLKNKLNFDFNGVDKTNKVNKKALDYIFYKTFKIAETYKSNYGELFNFKEKKLLYKERFKEHFKNRFKEKKISAYLDKLFILPGSHTTNKIRQVVNFLRFNNENEIEPKEEEDPTVDALIENIDTLIKKSSSKNITRIECIPPPIYNVDYHLVSSIEKEPEKTSSTRLSLLSSGEKQKINSVSSIIYHLINIDSVIENTNIVRYNNVNIVFEEIELYFHPDMQRTFVKFLHDSIRNLSLQNISAINIILVTHSPFILSDIPHPNILYLDLQEGESKEILAFPKNKDTRTLGANIHELLADSFFMEKGFMGEYAKSKIKSIIGYLEEEIKAPFEKKPDWNKGLAKSFIDLIGEPLLRNSLLDLYNKAFFNTEDKIDAEIARLQKQKTVKR